MSAYGDVAWFLLRQALSEGRAAASISRVETAEGKISVEYRGLPRIVESLAPVARSLVGDPEKDCRTTARGGPDKPFAKVEMLCTAEHEGRKFRVVYRSEAHHSPDGLRIWEAVEVEAV